ncbi:MAG: Creatinine amidohydrolase [bacterium ADurb.Bin243]|nr:MAG: Creatinine amidohydrolase [bacterium ADurb.Bin243]HOD39978.1 creatininase family protein [Candidatus Wallbacteria bacterium]
MKFEYLTHEELSTLDFDRCILILPIGPYEQHGPHLPITTDIVIARYLAESLCETMKNEKYDRFGVEAPAFTYAPALVSDGIGKTPQLQPESFTAYLAETLSQYVETGFKNIMIVVHHFELKFIKSLIAAISTCESRHAGVKIYEPLSAYYYSGEYNSAIEKFIKSKKNSDEKQDEVYKSYLDIDFKKEIHADIKETSIMMYLLPRAVKMENIINLPPFQVNPAAEFLKLNFTFKSMGAQAGYLGTPSRASMFLGELIFKQLRTCLLKSVSGVFAGAPPEFTVPLYIKAILTVI